MASRITDVDEFLRKSREEYKLDRQRDRLDREEAEDDNKFANSTDASKSQWDPTKKKVREEAFRPVLQFNRIHTYLQHVCNAGRQNKPAIKISAGEDGIDETAQFYESRIRQIIYQCDGDTARDTARDQQVASGRGFIRVTTEEIPGTDRQRPVVEPIENQFSVTWGPHRKYDASDATRCWVVTRISKEQHKLDYGEESVLNRTDFAYDSESGLSDWVGVGERGDMVQIAEKFVKFPDGKVVRFVINGAEILEEGEALTDDIGIVPQWGRQAVVDGVRRAFSLHNNGKDWQRLINLYASNIAENIGKQPKDRYLAPIGSIPEHLEDDYSQDTPRGIKYWNEFREGGGQFSKPEIERWEPPIEALSAGLQQSIEGLKASMGIYDASMGQRSNETSGIAINRRKVEGEVTNFHFPDNEARTWKRVGTILIAMISKLDKSGSSVPVRHADGKTEMVPIGVPYKHPKTGKVITHVLDQNAYDLEVEQGPSYANAREQAEESQQGLIKAAPELLFTGVGVNWIRNSGRPGADEDADALEHYINMKTPGLLPDKDQQQIPPQVQAQMQAMGQKLKVTEAFAQELHQQIQTKQAELQAKSADNAENNRARSADLAEANRVKLLMVEAQEETKRVIALAKLQSEEAQKKLEEELGIIRSKVDLIHEARMKAADQVHEAVQSEADRQHELKKQQIEQQHAQTMQGADQTHEADLTQQKTDAAAEQAEAGRAHEAEQSDADRKAAAEAAAQKPAGGTG